MSASNHTTNYNLPQYEPTDTPKYLTDFNGAMQTIDTTIKSVADSIPNVDSLETQIEQATETSNTANTNATNSLKKATQNENALASFFEGFSNWKNWTPSE